MPGKYIVQYEINNHHVLRKRFDTPEQAEAFRIMIRTNPKVTLVSRIGYL